MSDYQDHKVVYVSHPASGLARSNFPLVSHVSGSKIVRSLPFYIPDDVRLYEIKTSRGTFSRPKKEVQMPLAFAAKRRVHSASRVTRNSASRYEPSLSRIARSYLSKPVKPLTRATLSTARRWPTISTFSAPTTLPTTTFILKSSLCSGVYPRSTNSGRFTINRA